nr:immunoglobulin light chain junction region [Macaca mulatta]MPO03409.1 immunoglobulin light chain junction region [Macaca mulatta]MPO03457.1 immunoglobulin light chain junction region [Macaca mulatta]MPO03503.1 immunoglobulin light chain junction region [Macaca mulatta]MPO03507.1 immunoglobulin light chain junction region [Macaca mulatta]
CSSYADSNVFF